VTCPPSIRTTTWTNSSRPKSCACSRSHPRYDGPATRRQARCVRNDPLRRGAHRLGA
jgi:hypothetical protein